MSPGPHIVRPLESITARVMLCPAYNVLASAWMLTTTDDYSGLDEWVERTAASLPAERAERSHLIFEGLFDAAVLIEQDPPWPDFPAYLADLATRSPQLLRDRFLHRLIAVAAPIEIPDSAHLLADRAAYLDLVRAAIPGRSHDLDLHAQAHALLNDPPAMQALIVEHLGWLWDHALADEWARVAPLLGESADLYAAVDLSGQSVLDAVRTVTGRNLDHLPTDEVRAVEHLTFIPSAHVGPYLVFFSGQGMLYVVFGARHPAGLSSGSADLTRVELLGLLDALADDTRLRILEWVARSGEQFAQDIMTRFDLSQSAASRHLRQLSAAGFLVERRQGGASKAYHLNGERLREVTAALEVLLLRH